MVTKDKKLKDNLKKLLSLVQKKKKKLASQQKNYINKV